MFGWIFRLAIVTTVVVVIFRLLPRTIRMVPSRVALLTPIFYLTWLAFDAVSTFSGRCLATMEGGTEPCTFASYFVGDYIIGFAMTNLFFGIIALSIAYGLTYASIKFMNRGLT